MRAGTATAPLPNVRAPVTVYMPLPASRKPRKPNQIRYDTRGDNAVPGDQRQRCEFLFGIRRSA